MQPLSPIQVYVPRLLKHKVLTQFPEDVLKWITRSAHMEDDGDSQTYVIPDIVKVSGTNQALIGVLDKKELYVFDRKELEGLLGEVFDHAIEWNDLEQSARVQGGYKKNFIQNKSEYLKSILP